jgi:hypothetical protein
LKGAMSLFFAVEFFFSDATKIILCVDLIIPPLPEGGGGYTVLPLSVCPSVRPSKIFFSATWWKKSDIC